MDFFFNVSWGTPYNVNNFFCIYAEKFIFSTHILSEMFGFKACEYTATVMIGLRHCIENSINAH